MDDAYPSYKELLAWAHMRLGLPTTKSVKRSKAEVDTLTKRQMREGFGKIKQVPIEYIITDELVQAAMEVYGASEFDKEVVNYLVEEFGANQHDAAACTAIAGVLVSWDRRDEAKRLLGRVRPPTFPDRWGSLVDNGFSKNAALYFADTIKAA